MGKKSTPQAPAAPDPVATANAQGAANTKAAITQANLNRIDQVTPNGALTYSQIGTNPDGTPRYQQTQTYSPEQQALYDQQNKIAQSLGGLAQDNIGRVAGAQATPFTFDGMTPLQAQVGAGPIGQYNGEQGPLTSNVNAGPVQSNIENAGRVQRGVRAGPLQQSLDYTNLEALPNANNFNGAAQSAADAVYGQAASRLDPRFQQEESDIRSRLANQGISDNSDAFRRELDNFGRTKTDAYNQAQYSSIEAGRAAQQQGYAQALATRQQGVGETNDQGQFRNSTQGQGFQQGVTDANINNNAQGQIFGQNTAQQQATNQAQSQLFDQGQLNANLNNTAQAQQQQMALAALGFNNTSQNQQFNQSLAGGQFNNANRQQQIQEASYLRNLPLSDIAALLGTGGGVQDPQFNQFAQVGVAAPDYQGAVYKNYDAANQQYQQKLQARSSGLGSIFGLAGSLGAAAITHSDRRLKYAIKRVGTLANGLATYTFKYIGSAITQFGVMAQEALHVVPGAVITMPSGYMAVDYRKVW